MRTRIGIQCQAPSYPLRLAGTSPKCRAAMLSPPVGATQWVAPTLSLYVHLGAPTLAQRLVFSQPGRQRHCGQRPVGAG